MKKSLAQVAQQLLRPPRSQAFHRCPWIRKPHGSHHAQEGSAGRLQERDVCPVNMIADVIPKAQGQQQKQPPGVKRPARRDGHRPQDRWVQQRAARRHDHLHKDSVALQSIARRQGAPAELVPSIGPVQRASHGLPVGSARKASGRQG
eukprot:scaffold475_cov279-Pinguiococcus_pyrenoidosus.AAC.16